jgi:hypothetical protein
MMDRTRRRRLAISAGALVVCTFTVPGLARAQNDATATVRAPAVIASSSPVAPVVAARSGPAAATLGRPIAASLGVPTAVAQSPVPPAAILLGPPTGPASLAGSASSATPVEYRTLSPASFETPAAAQNITVRSQAPDPPPPPLSGPAPVLVPGGVPPAPPLSAGDVPPPPVLGPPGTTYGGVAVDQPIKKSFLDRCKDIFSPGSPDSKCGGWFQSDHAFDNFTNCADIISPVSSPFLFEDPRALTEVRPIFLIQTAPNRNAAFSGGNSEFYGIQARLAITDRWSIVLNELGAVTFNPGSSDVGIGNDTGFAEIHVGPKWTFYRDEQAGRLAAAGVTLEIPAGSGSVFQNTGSLSLDPYVSFGQTFGRTSYGTFNFLTTGGWSFSVDDERTDYLHFHFHLDYDVGNLHYIYPLVELNWYHTTSNGKANDGIGTEGGDLVNFGSPSYDGKNDLVTMAFGARYKFGGSDHYQVGAAFEFPLTDRKDLQSFRFGLDFIIRY